MRTGDDPEPWGTRWAGAVTPAADRTPRSDSAWTYGPCSGGPGMTPAAHPSAVGTGRGVCQPAAAPSAEPERTAMDQGISATAPQAAGPAGRQRWWRVALVLAPVLGFLGLLAYGFTRDPRAIPSPLVARPAPDFQLTLFNGSQVRLSEFRGRVVFLNFWASWCPPCRAEARLLEAAWRHYRDRGVVFLGVNIQDREASARSFLDEFGITYPNGRDPQNRIAIDYGVYGLPETFFISRDGLITYKHIGAIGGDLLAGKMEEALRGAVSAEGRGADYRSIR